MAAGCAVVSSDVYSVPEVAGDAALLFDPDDTDAHAQTIQNLLADDDRRRDRSSRATGRAEQFTWGKAAEATEDVYRAVLGSDVYDEESIRELFDRIEPLRIAATGHRGTIETRYGNGGT